MGLNYAAIIHFPTLSISLPAPCDPLASACSEQPHVHHTHPHTPWLAFQPVNPSQPPPVCDRVQVAHWGPGRNSLHNTTFPEPLPPKLKIFPESPAAPHLYVAKSDSPRNSLPEPLSSLLSPLTKPPKDTQRKHMLQGMRFIAAGRMLCTHMRAQLLPAAINLPFPAPRQQSCAPGLAQFKGQ